jgi:hypothetical protein
MVTVGGREFTHRELLRRVGSLAQVGGVQASTLEDGRGRGARLLHFSTAAGLTAVVLPDRAMDLAQVGWCGHELSWIGDGELTSPALYQFGGQGFARSFFGGLLTTCGLTNIGPACEDQGEQFPMHGYLPGLPAGDVAWGETWTGDQCTLWARGKVRQWRLFGENLTLSREISMSLDGTSLTVQDVVRNEGFAPTPHMILYHANAGFPLLDEGAVLHGRFASVTPRDEAARPGLPEFNRAIAPQSGFAEQVFILSPEPDEAGWNAVTLWNPALAGGLGLRVRWSATTLPWLILWRMMGEGAYVMGIEPSNCPTIEGRAVARERGTLPILEPGEERSYYLAFSVVTEAPQSEGRS